MLFMISNILMLLQRLLCRSNHGAQLCMQSAVSCRVMVHSVCWLAVTAWTRMPQANLQGVARNVQFDKCSTSHML
jgi:hypothetical protein